MNAADRERAFADAVLQRFGASARTTKNKAYGVSNSAKVISGGIQLAVLNLDRFDPEADGYVFFGVMRFVPDDEVLFALTVREGLGVMAARLDTMKSLGLEAEASGATPQYAARNNNVVGYLARDGSLYLRNKGFWDALPQDLSAAGTPIAIAGLYTATSSGTGVVGHGAREFVDYLAGLVGERWTPLWPWGAPGSWPELAAAVERSSLVVIEGAPHAVLDHALVEWAATGQPDAAPSVGKAITDPEPLRRAIAAAEAHPGRRVWFVQPLAGDAGRRWVEGLEMALRFGMGLAGEGPRRPLPRNLVLVGAWHGTAPADLPVGVIRASSPAR